MCHALLLSIYQYALIFFFCCSDDDGISLQFMDSPLRTFWLAIKGAVRSTTFLSAFVGIFQVDVC